MRKYVLKDKSDAIYFVDPSYASWDFTKNIHEATTFDTLEEAKRVARAVNVGSLHTFWEWDETPPKAVVLTMEGVLVWQEDNS